MRRGCRTALAAGIPSSEDFVIPAEAGIHSRSVEIGSGSCDTSETRPRVPVVASGIVVANPAPGEWIPASAGMTDYGRRIALDR